MPHESPHGRVEPQALRIVHIFVTGEPPEDRLPEEGHERMLNVLAQADLGETLCRHPAQPKVLIQLPEGEQSRIRGDGCAPELQLQAAVEMEFESALRGFTHWVVPTTGQKEGLSTWIISCNQLEGWENRGPIWEIRASGSCLYPIPCLE